MTRKNGTPPDGLNRHTGVKVATAAELAAALEPEALLADFADALHRRTDRPLDRTVGTRVRHVEEWFAYAARRGVDPLRPDVSNVEHYASRAAVRDRRTGGTRRPSAEVTRQRLTALTQFFDMTCRAGLTPANLARALPRPRNPEAELVDVRRLTPAEIAETLKAARADGPPVYAIFRTLADIGPRGVEVQRAELRDYRPRDDGPPVLRAVGRGGLVAMRPLPESTVDAIDDALAWRRAVAPRHSQTHPTGPLYATPKGHHRHGNPERLTADRFHTLFRRVLRASGIDRPDEVAPHAYRHAWVRHGVACGWDVTAVQREIGHRHLSSTLRYLVGGTGALHPLAATIRPMTTFVAESVVMLRAISGGESLPVAEEITRRKVQADQARRDLETLRELHESRVEAAVMRAELERTRARLATLDPEFAA